MSAYAKEADKMDKEEWAEQFRQQVLARGGVGPRARYTPEQRQQAVEGSSRARAWRRWPGSWG